MRSEGAEGSSATSDCDDPLVVIACAAESDACPAACRESSQEEENDEIVKSGSLVVKSSAAGDRSVVVSTTAKAVSDLDTLTFKTSEEVTITKVVLEKYGYSTAANLISQVWLEDEDGNQITSKATPNAKGLVNLTMKKDYKVVDGTLNATIVVETNINATVGGTLGFKVSDVVSTAKDVDLGDYKAYTYDVVKYDGTQATVSARGGSKEYSYEAGESYEVSKFKVKAPDDSAIKVSGFTLTDAGDLKIYDYFDEIEVLVAGEAVKATTSVNKDEELTVSFKNAIEIAAKASTEFVINVTLNDEFDDYGKKVVLKINSASDLSATDKNNARISVAGYGAGSDWLEYKFNGGKVKVTNNKLGNVEASINSVDVLIADGTISVGEDVKGSVTITLNSNTAFTVTDEGTCSDATITTQAACTSPATWTATNFYPAQGIEAIRLVIAGEEYDGVFDDKTAANPVVTFSNVEISESGKVKLYVDTLEDSKYQGQSLSFGSLVWDLDYDADDSDVDVSGNISVSRLTLNESRGTLTNNLSSADNVEYLVNEDNTRVVLDGTYTAKKNDIYLNEFTVEPQRDGDIDGDSVADTIAEWNTFLTTNKNKISFYLTVDGDEVADAVLTCTPAATPTACKASDTFSDVLVKAGQSVSIKLEAEVDAKTVAELGTFMLTVAGVDANDNDAGSASRKSAPVAIVNKGSATVSSDKSNTVLRKAADSVLAEFIVKPDGSASITLEEIAFTLNFADVAYDGDVNLYIDNGSEDFDADYTFAADTDVVLTSTLNKTVDKGGVVVKVELDSAWAGKVSLTALSVNGTPFNNKTFSRYFVDPYVWIESQKDDGIATTFYFGVEKKSTDTVENLQIYYNAAWHDIKAGGEITDGDYDEVLDGAASYYVEAIRYNGSCSDATYTTATACTTNSKTWTPGVLIEKSTYNDFFRIDDTYARVAKAKD